MRHGLSLSRDVHGLGDGKSERLERWGVARLTLCGYLPKYQTPERMYVLYRIVTRWGMRIRSLVLPGRGISFDLIPIRTTGSDMYDMRLFLCFGPPQTSEMRTSTHERPARWLPQ